MPTWLCKDLAYNSAHSSSTLSLSFNTRLSKKAFFARVAPVAMRVSEQCYCNLTYLSTAISLHIDIVTTKYFHTTPNECLSIKQDRENHCTKMLWIKDWSTAPLFPSVPQQSRAVCLVDLPAAAYLKVRMHAFSVYSLIHFTSFISRWSSIVGLGCIIAW